MFLLETGAFSLETLAMPVMLIGMLVFLYFFMIRPQKKQQQEEQQMRNGLAVGDEVTTIGGIIGKVISIKGETFVLETTKDKTKIRFLKGAVRNIDVKASDVAASVIETQEVPADEVVEAPVEAHVEAPVEAPVETETNEENQ